MGAPASGQGAIIASTPIRHGLFLSYAKMEDGRNLAVCSDGTPQLGHDPVTVLTLEVVQSFKEAKQWFSEVKKTRPWETRN